VVVVEQGQPVLCHEMKLPRLTGKPELFKTKIYKKN
jgi:hypothetical protein